MQWRSRNLQQSHSSLLLHPSWPADLFPSSPPRLKLAVCMDPEAVCGHVSTARELRRDETTSVSPTLRLAAPLSSCPHGCACGLPLNHTNSINPGLVFTVLLWPHHPIKSRFLRWWGHECSRSARDSFANKMLPVLSTHSGSHGCDFDRVFTKSYKWPDNMWTARIFWESSFLLVQKIRHEQHWKTVWLYVGVKPSPSVEDFNRPCFLQALFYFPKSVKVDFSICCLAQGCLTGSKEGETGAAG